MFEIPFEIQTPILLVVAAFNFILGLIVFLTNKSNSSKAFAITSVSVGLWSIGIAIFVIPGITKYTQFNSNINYILATIISFSYLLFCHFFASENAKPTNRFLLISVLSWITTIILVLIPGLVIESVVEINGLKIDQYGPLYPVFITTVSSYLLVGLYLLSKKYKTISSAAKRQVRIIFIGTGLSILLAIAFNIILPAVFDNSNFVWAGPIGTMINVLFVTYALTRHGLWDPKLIITELFSAGIFLTLLSEIIFTEKGLTSILEIAVLVLVTISIVVLIRGMLKKVGERERMEELATNIRKANKRLAEVDVQKSDFVSIASHQLRTPLTVISGYTSMLLEGAFGEIKDKTQRDVIEKMFRAGKTLVLIIEGYLDISKIDKKEMQYNFVKIDFKDLLTKKIKELSKSAHEADLELLYKTDGHAMYAITADQAKFSQVIHNLIDNSIKYTPRGGKIEVSLLKHANDGKIILEIKDNGIGISPQMMSRLFEKFSRAPGVSKLHTEGRGLGLYVSKSIINAHGGNLWVRSEGQGKGSTFFIELADADTGDKRQEIKGFINEL